jgi:glycosyltransferase involved in cell wall biosynthesis
MSIGVRSSQIAQIQNAVDDQLFSPVGPKYQFEGPGPILLVVGQLIDRKGLQQLIESADRLRKKGYLFSIKLLGSGHKKDELQALCSNLGLENIEFLGGVNPATMPAYYRGADLLLFPTLEDIWGLVVNEALLCGLPVLCSCYAGCANELLEPQQVFDPLDPADFDRALIRAISEPESRKADASRLWPMEKVVEVIRSDIHQHLNPKVKI